MLTKEMAINQEEFISLFEGELSYRGVAWGGQPPRAQNL